MDDGGTVPDHADGMGCFDLGNGKIALVRNHELNPGQSAGSLLSGGYGKDREGNFLPGGTRGAARGATIFARGEGLHMGQGELYFCCTAGGAAGLGQIFRLRIGDTSTDHLQLFFESTSPEQFNFGDNLTIAPNGHLIVCEDQYTQTTTTTCAELPRQAKPIRLP